MTQLIILGAHTPSAVHEQYYLLIAFILIFACYKFLTARSGFPVKLSQAVPHTIFTQLLKLQAAAAPRFLFNTHLTGVIVGCENGIGSYRHKVRINFHRAAVAAAIANLPEPEGAGD